MPAGFLIAAVATASAASPPPRPYLDAARRAAAWLDTVRVVTEGGAAWPAAPARSGDVERNLYSGTCGVILFLIELHRVTGEERFRAEVIKGADDLLHARRSASRDG